MNADVVEDAEFVETGCAVFVVDADAEAYVDAACPYLRCVELDDPEKSKTSGSEKFSTNSAGGVTIEDINVLLSHTFSISSISQTMT